MSTDDPIVRPNLMHLGGAGGAEGMGHGDGGCGCGGHGMGHGGGGCGCGGHGEGHGHGRGEGKAEGVCGCGGHGHASRDYVVIEPVSEKVTQPEVVA